jgi:hypothetical protein
VFNDTSFGAIAPIKAGVNALANVVLGASHPIQSALPKIFAPETEEVSTSHTTP